MPKHESVTPPRRFRTTDSTPRTVSIPQIPIDVDSPPSSPVETTTAHSRPPEKVVPSMIASPASMPSSAARKALAQSSSMGPPTHRRRPFVEITRVTPQPRRTASIQRELGSSSTQGESAPAPRPSVTFKGAPPQLPEDDILKTSQALNSVRASSRPSMEPGVTSSFHDAPAAPSSSTSQQGTMVEDDTLVTDINELQKPWLTWLSQNLGDYFRHDEELLTRVARESLESLKSSAAQSGPEVLNALISSEPAELRKQGQANLMDIVQMRLGDTASKVLNVYIVDHSKLLQPPEQSDLRSDSTMPQPPLDNPSSLSTLTTVPSSVDGEAPPLPQPEHKRVSPMEVDGDGGESAVPRLSVSHHHEGALDGGPAGVASMPGPPGDAPRPQQDGNSTHSATASPPVQAPQPPSSPAFRQRSLPDALLQTKEHEHHGRPVYRPDTSDQPTSAQSPADSPSYKEVLDSLTLLQAQQASLQANHLALRQSLAARQQVEDETFARLLDALANAEEKRKRVQEEESQRHSTELQTLRTELQKTQHALQQSLSEQQSMNDDRFSHLLHLLLTGEEGRKKDRKADCERHKELLGKLQTQQQSHQAVVDGIVKADEEAKGRHDALGRRLSNESKATSSRLQEVENRVADVSGIVREVRQSQQTLPTTSSTIEEVARRLLNG